MYPLVFPLEPSLLVSINGQQVGMLQSYQSLSKRETSPITAFGCSDMVALFPGPWTYSVTLERLVLDFNDLPEQVRPYELEDFTLTIQDDRQKLQFSGCQWVSIREGYQLGQSVAEELKLVAKGCSRTALI